MHSSLIATSSPVDILVPEKEHNLIYQKLTWFTENKYFAESDEILNKCYVNISLVWGRLKQNIQ